MNNEILLSRFLVRWCEERGLFTSLNLIRLDLDLMVGNLDLGSIERGERLLDTVVRKGITSRFLER